MGPTMPSPPFERVRRVPSRPRRLPRLPPDHPRPLLLHLHAVLRPRHRRDRAGLRPHAEGGASGRAGHRTSLSLSTRVSEQGDSGLLFRAVLVHG